MQLFLMDTSNDFKSRKGKYIFELTKETCNIIFESYFDFRNITIQKFLHFIISLPKILNSLLWS